MRILSIFLTLMALIAGLLSCAQPIAEDPVQYNLTVSSSGGGSVITPGEDTFAYEEGAVVDLVATADDGYRFANWTGDVDTIVDVEAASTTITMNGHYEIIANFEEAHELTVSSTQGGSVTTPGEGVFTYEAGAVVSLVASPASGHRFVNWTGDVDTTADVEAASTTITLDGDYSINANFVAQYVLTIGSTEGGEVTNPGQATFTYDAGTVVELVAEADEGYTFMEWTGDVDSVTDVTAASTTVTMNGGYTITAGFAKEIRTWYDLDAIRDNLGGNYVLMNDLDSATPGYSELAGSAANDGKGWEPIGRLCSDPFTHGLIDTVDPFIGSFDGQGYEINDLSVSRDEEDGVGIFSFVGSRGVVQNVGLTTAEVTGRFHVGVLAGANSGTLSSSYVSGRVTGERDVGGLVGENFGTVISAYSSGSVNGGWGAGGLVGGNAGTVDSCYSSGSVIGGSDVGGLVGRSWGTVNDCYSSGSVIGHDLVGGLVGRNWGTVGNSYYNYDEVVINGERVVTIGALFSEDFEQWLANGKFLDVNERLAQDSGYYLIEDVDDFKQLLAFGQDSSLKFRLKSDLDLGTEPNLYIPYLAGEFHGNGHRISNLTLTFGSLGQVGLFGYIAHRGEVNHVGAENILIADGAFVGGLVGENNGSVSNSYITGSVAGHHHVGGLVGYNAGTLSNCHYNYDEVVINGERVVTIGALFSEDFEQWLANGKFLDVNERLAQDSGYYLIEDVDDFKQLLAFGQDSSLKFRLKSDLDLGTEPNLYIPYLAGEFHGNGHRISNLALTFGFVSHVGLFGYLASGGKLAQVVVENVNITGDPYVGGLVARNNGTVSNCYSTGSVIGSFRVGGLVGDNSGTVNNSYSSSSVSGSEVGGLVGVNSGVVANSYAIGSVSGSTRVGGLVARNNGTVSNCYSTGSVVGDFHVGGLVGLNLYSVSDSFWDVEASRVEESDAGAGKTTGQMKDLTTFTRWDIVAVTSGETNTAYIWNIVDGQTYPFLSWQPIS